MIKIGNKVFDTENHTYIMAVLNVTPDSFSDGGKWTEYDSAMKHVDKLAADGADVLDIGGESTRPGYQEISADEETGRVVPLIEAVKQNFDLPVSIDTYKTEVAKEALEAGADLVNDIWGFKYDDRMAGLVKRYNAACCLMHNRKEAVYQNFLKDVYQDMEDSISIAKKAGIGEDKLLLDPGIGFGKTYEMNLEIMRNLDRFCKLGYPMLLGVSRKSVIGRALGLPVSEREEGTIVATVLAAQKKYGFVRVHDVKKNRRAIQMLEAVGIR